MVCCCLDSFRVLVGVKSVERVGQPDTQSLQGYLSLGSAVFTPLTDITILALGGNCLLFLLFFNILWFIGTAS